MHFRRAVYQAADRDGSLPLPPYPYNLVPSPLPLPSPYPKDKPPPKDGIDTGATARCNLSQRYHARDSKEKDTGLEDLDR